MDEDSFSSNVIPLYPQVFVKIVDSGKPGKRMVQLDDRQIKISYSNNLEKTYEYKQVFPSSALPNQIYQGMILNSVT